jgi:hypothetical protein
VTTVCQAHITNEPIKLKIIEEKEKEYGREIKEESEQSRALQISFYSMFTLYPVLTSSANLQFE